MLLSIETSCDETAVAILDVNRWLKDDSHFDKDGRPVFLLADVVSSQANLHQVYGGVVPELAAREHITNLPLVVEQCFQQASCSFDDLTAIAATRGPGLKGCLLVGLCFAKALAYSKQIPFVPVNHLEGHLFAGELLPAPFCPELPLLALLVSGGHTLLVYVKKFRSYEIDAQTRDDAAGEAFDKIATLLGLAYPGGPALSRSAALGDSTKFSFPVGAQKDSGSFSFSGLKTSVSRTVKSLGERLRDEQTVRDLAASAQACIVKSLVDKTVVACKNRNPRSLLLTGGVAANSCLREALAKEMSALGIQFCVPPPRWCTDNAAMIGMVAALIMKEKTDQFKGWRPGLTPEDALGPDVGFDIGAVARWPLGELRGV